MLEEYAELVAPQTGHRIAGTHRPPEQVTQLLQQFVSREVAAGVVDPLEAVQVQEAEGVFAPFLRRAHERVGQAALELGAVHEARQGVVRRLVRQLPRHLSGMGNVSSNQDRPRDCPCRIPDRRH